MHGEGIFGYGLWTLAAINIALFMFFIMSFLVPFRKREWRSMGVVVAFFVALFTEMYGFPLTIYFLTGILGTKYPALDPFSHANGHLWVTLFGGGSTMMNNIHLISNGLVIIGFIIMWRGWRLIHSASDRIVTTGIYSYVRHPQYSGLFIVMAAMLIQWPSITALVMAPILLIVYYRLSRKEERNMIEKFGNEYRQYMMRTKMFIPSLRRSHRRSFI